VRARTGILAGLGCGNRLPRADPSQTGRSLSWPNCNLTSQGIASASRRSPLCMLPLCMLHHPRTHDSREWSAGHATPSSGAFARKPHARASRLAVAAYDESRDALGVCGGDWRPRPQFHMLPSDPWRTMAGLSSIVSGAGEGTSTISGMRPFAPGGAQSERGPSERLIRTARDDPALDQ